MKFLKSILVMCLLCLGASAAPILQSGWTTTTDPATARAALGISASWTNLAQTNTIPRVLISDATPQDAFRWINLTNGLARFPAWSSDRIVGSLTPGIHFLSVTNGADHFSIDVQHDHAAAGKSEARMIGLWDMAIVPGYNSGIQLGASTDNYNQEVHVQYANRMGWSHLFNLRGNTNGNIGSITLQGRRISTSTNLSELWIWANEPTWNNYPTPGFSATGPQIAKLAIGGTYFYSDLYTPRTIVTNRQLIGAGPMFYSTDGGMELSSGNSDGFMVGGDLGAATRTTGSSKYFWLTMTPKTHSNARMNLLSAANDGATTATINIGGGSGGATAPANRVKIWAGADSTANGTGSLGIDVSNGLVTTTNLVVNGTITGNGSGLTNVAGFNTNIAGAGMISNSSPVLTFNGSNVFAGPVFFGGNVTVGNGLPSYFSNLYTTNFTIFSNTPPAAPLTYGEIGFYVSNGVPYVMDSSLSGAHTWLTTNRFGSSPQQIADSLGGLPMNGRGITNIHSTNIVFHFTTLPTLTTNTLVVKNGETYIDADYNVAITNIIIAGQRETLVVSNHSASTIAAFVTTASRKIGGVTSNGIQIAAGKFAYFSFDVNSGKWTNYAAAVEP